MADDALGDRRRVSEEDYFKRKDRELIEKMRQAAAADQARRDLSTSAGLTDPELLRELEELGFTPDTLGLLPLVPLLQMAWAEGGITPAERDLILALARARGIGPGSGADAQLQRWLAHQPAAEVFTRARRLIGAMLDTGAEDRKLSAAELIDQCERIAAASGGIFGLGKISGAERTLLAQIAADLQRRT